MQIDHVLAALSVADMDRAVRWYERLLGRPADDRSIAEAAEWRLSSGASLQLVLAPETAGKSRVTLGVEDIEEIVADLAVRGIQGHPTAPGDGPFRLVRIPDADGNVITFAEDQRPERAESLAEATGGEQLVQSWIGGA